uniref:Uncharacterized protein n=1 Tax=Timema poppense TaxID=170557 RepID=A0A7R9DW15_TIMPO|nr:unnamed protein product [Timema poppensis]
MFCLFADSLMMDWSQPVGPAEDELVLKWDDDEEEDSDPDTGALQMKTIKSSEEEAAVETTEAESGDGGHLDIMAQQLKFVACLKILMEELSTLATGFEVDGGQLRYQLYVWLEREVDALRQLCNYSAGDADAIGADRRWDAMDIQIRPKCIFQGRFERPGGAIATQTRRRVNTFRSLARQVTVDLELDND